MPKRADLVEVRDPNGFRDSNITLAEWHLVSVYTAAAESWADIAAAEYRDNGDTPLAEEARLTASHTVVEAADRLDEFLAAAETHAIRTDPVLVADMREAVRSARVYVAAVRKPTKGDSK